MSLDMITVKGVEVPVQLEEGFQEAELEPEDVSGRIDHLVGLLREDGIDIQVEHSGVSNTYRALVGMYTAHLEKKQRTT